MLAAQVCHWGSDEPDNFGTFVSSPLFGSLFESIVGTDVEGPASLGLPSVDRGTDDHRDLLVVKLLRHLVQMSLVAGS